MAVARDYEDEQTIAIISATYGIAPGTVYAIARKFKLKRRSEMMAAMREERNKAICERWKAKASLKEIAAEFKMSEAGISLIATKAGLARKKKSGAWKKHIQNIVNDYKAGIKVAVIGSKYDCDDSNIYRVLEKNGVIANRKYKDAR